MEEIKQAILDGEIDGFKFCRHRGQYKEVLQLHVWKGPMYAEHDVAPEDIDKLDLTALFAHLADYLKTRTEGLK